jgi:hypothetical protein
VLTFLKVLKPYSFNVQRVPLYLTATIMGMTVECRDNATETKCHGFLTK